MARNIYPRRNPRQFSQSATRAVWFILTALLILPLYLGIDEALGWTVLFPLMSVFTTLAGIIGFNHKIDIFKKYRASEIQSEQHATFAGTR